MSILRQPTEVEQQPSLRRVLSLGDLVWYGIVLVQPIAAVPLFGLADQLSEGHIVTTIAISMFAMVLTAISYGVMATVYPTSGSAYAYVGKGLNPHLGFLTGWAMMLDYLMIPVLNTIYGALTLSRIFPSVPYPIWAIVFVLIISGLNLHGVQTTARTNQILMVVMSLIICIFFVESIVYIMRLSGFGALFSASPFYSPGTMHLKSIATATSLAALTYVGFDGITTLSEEARNPERDVMRATVLVCLATGVLSGLQVYLAQLVWPQYRSFPDVDTAFMDVAMRAGGKLLFNGFAIILVIASAGSALAGQAGAARLLLGMGRDGALPKRIFSYVGARRRVPTYNLLLLGVICMTGALAFNFERAAELVNFGAFLAFIGVNIVACRHFHLHGKWKSAAMSAVGAIACTYIWLSLPSSSKAVGLAWFVIGVVYLCILTKGFRSKPIGTEFLG
jgi:putrescine importer